MLVNQRCFYFSTYPYWLPFRAQSNLPSGSGLSRLTLSLRLYQVKRELFSQIIFLFFRPGTEPLSTLKAQSTGLYLLLQEGIRSSTAIEFRNNRPVNIKGQIQAHQICIFQRAQHWQAQAKAV